MATAIQLDGVHDSRRATTSPGKTPRLASVPAPMLDRAETLDRVREVLDRPMPYAAEMQRCGCAECVELRARPFSCGQCGFAGEPLVNPCSCADERDGRIRMYQTALRDAKRRGADYTFGYTLERLSENLARAKAVPRPNVCLPSAKGGSCSHGDVECPVCVAGLDHPARECDRLHPWTVIRELRSVVRSTEPLPSVEPSHITAKVWHDDGGLIQVDIDGAESIYDAGARSRQGKDGHPSANLGLKSIDDVRALAFALLRACEAPQEVGQSA